MAWDYIAEVTADSPYLWYRMDEAAGPTAIDSAGTQDGTYSATTPGDILFLQTPIIQGVGTSLDVNRDGAGSDDAQVLLNPVTAWPTTEIGVEFVIEDIESAGGDKYCFSYAVAGEPDEFLRALNSSSIRLFVQGTEIGVSTTADSPYDGRSHHIYVDWRSSDGEYRVFWNGNFRGVGTTSVGSPLTDAGALMLWKSQTAPGTGGPTSSRIDGRFDQLAVYDTRLTEARVRAHASAALVKSVDFEPLWSVDFPLDRFELCIDPDPCSARHRQLPASPANYNCVRGFRKRGHH